MNIPIRTTLVANGELRFYAGGGIVADSTPEDEFEETETKIAAIRRAIASFPGSRATANAGNTGVPIIGGRIAGVPINGGRIE